MTIKNGDMPAMPTPVTETGSTGHGHEPSYGLTKREKFAIAALQGLLSERNYNNATKKAVRYADRLLDELEKPND